MPRPLRVKIFSTTPSTEDHDMKISIARDFSPSPGGRYTTDGPKSGEAFRDTILLPALKHAERKGDSVTVSLDGIPNGPGPSFLDEAFGGLVRNSDYSPARLRELMHVEASNPIHNPFHIELIWRYVDEAGSGKAEAK